MLFICIRVNDFFLKKIYIIMMPFRHQLTFSEWASTASLFSLIMSSPTHTLTLESLTYMLLDK